MKRYMMQLSYIGSQYRGSQKHIYNNMVDSDSIQGKIENILLKSEPKFENKPKLVMAGRTDAGVHALSTTAHVDLVFPKSETINYNKHNFVKTINRHLIKEGHYINILNFHEVSRKFHARFSAKSRTYLYRFVIPKYNLKIEPIAELQRSAIVYNRERKFDFNQMKKGVNLFAGKKDFNSFTTAITNKINNEQHYKSFVKTMNLSLEEAKPLITLDGISKNFSYWNFIFTSKSFLYNQIRRIVGSLFALGFHKISEEDIINMLQVPSHKNWNPHVQLAPPYGLYLLKVNYDNTDIQDISILK